MRHSTGGHRARRPRPQCERVTEDTEIRGQRIDKGDKVVIWHISADRDEEVFEDPFTFDVNRTPNENLSTLV